MELCISCGTDYVKSGQNQVRCQKCSPAFRTKYLKAIADKKYIAMYTVVYKVKIGDTWQAWSGGMSIPEADLWIKQWGTYWQRKGKTLGRFEKGVLTDVLEKLSPVHARRKGEEKSHDPKYELMQSASFKNFFQGVC